MEDKAVRSDILLMACLASGQTCFKARLVNLFSENMLNIFQQIFVIY